MSSTTASSSLSSSGAGLALEPVVETVHRLRLLAQRAALHAFWTVSAQSAQSDAADRAQAAFQRAFEEFSDLFGGLRGHASALELNAATLALLKKEVWSKRPLREAFERFMSDGASLAGALGEPGAADLARVAAFAELATETLDQAASGVMEELAKHDADDAEGDVNARALTMQTLSNLKELTVSIQLIALNASVEAARAGAAGRGFGVIAQEIKSLSGSAQSAVDAISNSLSSL